VIGAGSVLTTDLDAYTVAAGNPAEAVKSRR
jgi:acetyltransferase-like isoleucine patch superfamily enzyme